jgi:hypothetical protein
MNRPVIDEQTRGYADLLIGPVRYWHLADLVMGPL